MLLSYLIIAITSLKNSGIPLDEIKIIMKGYDFSIEVVDTLNNLVDAIYETSEQDNEKIAMSFVAKDMMSLINLTWYAIMLAIRVDYQKQQLTYIGKDGQDYYGQEALETANCVYTRQLYTKVTRY